MENKRTEAKSSYHVGGMSIVFVQLVLSVLFLVLAKENGMIPGKYMVPIGADCFGVFWNCVWFTVLEGKEIYSWTCDQYPGGSDSGQWYFFEIYKADELLVQVREAAYRQTVWLLLSGQMTRPRHWKMQKIIAMESRQVLMLRIQTRCWKM